MPTVNELIEPKSKKDLTLDEIQSQDWVLRIVDTIKSSKDYDVPKSIFNELESLMSECSEAYHNNSPALPKIETADDLKLLADKESRYVALLSRVAEITISLYRIKKKVEELWDVCEERLNRYPIVNKELTNERKRTLFYKATLKPLREKQEKVELAFEISSRIESHLNSLHFAIREVSAMSRDYLHKSGRVDHDQSF